MLKVTLSLAKRKRWFRCCKLVGFIILLPYIFGFTPADSSYTDFSFGAGGGQYVYEDCSGTHIRPFEEGGASVTTKLKSPFRAGIAAELYVQQEESKSSPHLFWYPDLALDWRYFSLGTTGIRVGDNDFLYGEVSIANQIPFVAGKGLLHMGIGGNPGAPFSRVWLGINQVPYRGSGLGMQVEFPLENNRFIFLNGRYGNYLSRPEYGFSVGMRIRYPK